MSSSAEMPDTGALARLAYEMSLRTLTLQESSVDELRARTGTLLAAASLVTSFLGGAAIARDGFDGWSFGALIAFVLAIAAATWVLLPRKNQLIFSIHGSRLYEGEIEADVFDIAETHRRLAYWLDGFHDENDAKISRLFSLFRWSTVALLLEVVLWSIQLALS